LTRKVINFSYGIQPEDRKSNEPWVLYG